MEHDNLTAFCTLIATANAQARELERSCTACGGSGWCNICIRDPADTPAGRALYAIVMEQLYGGQGVANESSSEVEVTQSVNDGAEPLPAVEVTQSAEPTVVNISS